MTEQEEPLEETNEALIHWYYHGLGEFMASADKLGYDLDWFEWDSLDALERYILETGVSHSSKEESEMTRFVACYTYLGFAINHKYKSKWVEIKDGSLHNGLLGIDNAVLGKPEMYIVPRVIIKSVILKRVPEGLKEFVRSKIEDEYVSTVANTPTEDEA